MYNAYYLCLKTHKMILFEKLFGPFTEFFTKGQLISKCPYEKSVSSKTKIFLDFCPEIICSFLGASWLLFWLPVAFLIYDITN